MKNRIKFFVIALIYSVLANYASGQVNYASNVSKRITETKVYITYDLFSTDGAKYFNVELKLTYANNQRIIPKTIIGSFGSGIEAGFGKTISWEFKKDFDGDIQKVNFEVFATKVDEPFARFETTITNNSYAPCEVVIKNLSEHTDEYQWDFGDPNSGSKNQSSELNPTHQYNESGKYEINLVARNSSLDLADRFVQTIVINKHEPVTADFQVKGDGKEPPATVEFINASSANSDKFTWNFGDPGSGRNNTSEEKDPSHKYSQAGKFTVELKVKNLTSGLENTVKKEVVIKQPDVPVPDFSFTLSSESAPSTVQFENKSRSATEFQWDFGDPGSGRSNSSVEMNPKHLYSNPGTYTILLYAYDKSRRSAGSKKAVPASQKITIKEPPKPPAAKFTIENNNQYNPVTVLFINKSTDADIFNWSFGDPDSGNDNTSTKSDPKHTYNKSGKFRIELIAVNSATRQTNRFSDTVFVKELVQIPDPVSSFTIRNNNIPGPAIVSFENNSSNADSYLWDFGDPGSASNSSAEASTSHEYKNPGQYNVTLKASNLKTGKRSTFNALVFILEPEKLTTAGFIILNNNVPVPASVSFTNNSTNADSYEWNFGDTGSVSNSSKEVSPTHEYKKPGQYNVVLKAMNKKTGKSNTYNARVTVLEPEKLPEARFTVGNNNAPGPVVIKFINNSINADSYQWDFGDAGSMSNSSKETSPSHEYRNPGQYTVTLWAINTKTGKNNTSSAVITVKEPEKLPEAGFTIGNNNTPGPAIVTFTNNSENADSYEWNFGDAGSASNSSKEVSPTHEYKKPGQYNVTLKAVKKITGKSNTFIAIVTVLEPEKLPEARFAIGNNNAPGPAVVKFTNNSINADSYQWDFGDAGSASNSSRETNPTHEYKDPGNYTVTLLAISKKTGKNNTNSAVVIVKEPEKLPEAGFTVDNNIATCPVIVSFTNNSMNADSYEWNFGDAGSTSNSSKETSPRHEYKKSGQFNVTLKAINKKTGQSNTYNTLITVLEPEKLPEARFAIDNNNGTSPAVVRFTNNSVNADSYLWDFGDAGSTSNSSKEFSPAHEYKNPGQYTATLWAINSKTGKNNTSSSIVSVREPEKLTEAGFAVGNNNAPSPSIVSFTNNSVNADSFEWNFGDTGSASNLSKEVSPVHEYKKPGQYSVTLKALNKKTGKSNTFTAIVTVLEPENLPEARFTFDNNNIPGPAVVTFTNNSINADSYQWDFGDAGSGSNSSKEASPKHEYKKPGQYTVTLWAINKKTGKNNTYSALVTVVEPEKLPEARFTIDNNNIPGPAVVTFINNSVNADSYQWDFGDAGSGSNSSKEASPKHEYKNPGQYSVTLWAVNTKTGKNNTTSATVFVNEPERLPEARFTIGNNNAPGPAIVIFTNNSINSDSYEWDFGDSGPGSNTSSEVNPSHEYKKSGRYNVVLKALNKKTGKRDTFSDFVTIVEAVKHPVAEFMVGNNNSVGPATIQFNNDSKNATNFIWDFGDPGSGSENTSTEKNPTHLYNKPGEYKVVLKAVNTSTGESVEQTGLVVIAKPVVPPPSADFTVNMTGNYAPVEVEFKNNSLNTDKYKWNFGDPLSSDNESTELNPHHNYKNPGNYRITLEAGSSSTGESKSLTKEITIARKYLTYYKSLGASGLKESACAVVKSGKNDYLVLVSHENAGSSVIKMNEEGIINDELKLNSQFYDLSATADDKKFLLTGIEPPNRLLIQFIQDNLKTQEPVYLESSENYILDYATPRAVAGINNNIGIFINYRLSGGGYDVRFLKLDENGNKVPLTKKALNFPGLKIAQQIIPADDGSFILLGYFEESDSIKKMLFATVDTEGIKKLSAIRSRFKRDLIGCDIVPSFTDGYTVLKAEQCEDDHSMFDLNLYMINNAGDALSCTSILPGRLKNEDLIRFIPRMLHTNEGFVVLGYSLNGNDNDIHLYWIDKTGNQLIRHKEITLPGDQFVTDFMQLDDGGFMITGAERLNNDYNALIIRTDPFGNIQ